MSVSYKDSVNTAQSTLSTNGKQHIILNIRFYRHISYYDEKIPKVSHIKFLGKVTDIALSWRNHTEQVERCLLRILIR